MDSVKFSLYQRLNIIGIAVGILYFALRYGALPSYNSPEYSSAPTRESPVLQPTTAKPVASTQDNVNVSTSVNQSAIEKNITIDINDLDRSGYAITSGSTLRIVGWDTSNQGVEVHFGNFGWTNKSKRWQQETPKRDAFLAVPITIHNNTGSSFRVGFKSENQTARDGFIYNDVYPGPGEKIKETTLLDVTSQKDHEIILTIRRFTGLNKGKLLETIDIPLLYTPPVPVKINRSYEDRKELPPRLAREVLPPSSPITASTIDINDLSETGYLIDNGSLVSIMGWSNPESVLEIHFDHFQWIENGLSFTAVIHNRIRSIDVLVIFRINDMQNIGGDRIVAKRRRTVDYYTKVEQREEHLIDLYLTMYKFGLDGHTEETLVIPFIYRSTPTIAEDIVASPSEASNEPLSVSQSATPPLEYLFSHADISMTIDDLIQLVPLINNRNLSDILEDSSINQDPNLIDIINNTSIKFIVANSSIVRIIPIADFDIETFMEWLGAISAESVGVTKVTYIVNYKDITYEGSFQIRVTE